MSRILDKQYGVKRDKWDIWGKWDKHIDKILKKVGSGIAMLRRAETFIPTSSLQMVYNALIS